MEILSATANTKSFLCYIGYHQYEQEPYWKDYVKSTGIDCAFWSSGIQAGLQKCQYCKRERWVFRTGMVGSGGKADNWKKLSKRKLAWINSLSIM